MSIHLPRRITVRSAIMTAIATLVAVMCLLTAGSSISHADACVAGPVSIVAKKNAKLMSPLRLRVYATCDDAPYSATARGYLCVAGHRTATLSTLKLENVVTGTVRHTTIKVSRAALDATRAYARRHHHDIALLKFVVRASGKVGGREPHAYRMSSDLRI